MRLLLGLCCLLLAAPSRAESPEEMIRLLTAPALAGRGAGTAGERAAAELVASWLTVAGLQPGFADGWIQEVPWSNEDSDGIAVNVAGTLTGEGDLAERWIVLGAHIDHLGRVDPHSDGVPEPGAYYPGAGDNASGVAAVMAAVLRLAESQAGSEPGHSGRRSLLVCGFGAEEVGLIGSAYFTVNLPIPPEQIDAMVNLDAVGRLGTGPLNIAGLETCNLFADLLADAAGDLEIRTQNTSLLQSDHQSFLAREIPAVFLFTGGYPEMNSPADDLAAVDLAGLDRVIEVTAVLVANLLRAGEPFAFHAPPVVDGPDVGEGNRQTWFGSVPDFGAEQGAGYAIGGVSESGPAARAGLRQGDVLVDLGGFPVTDLTTFTSALRRHDPGDVVEVEVRRDGQPLRFYVTLGDRSQRGR